MIKLGVGAVARVSKKVDFVASFVGWVLRLADKDPGEDQMQLAEICVPFLQVTNKGSDRSKVKLRVKNATHKRSRQSSKNEKSKNRKSRGKEFNVYWQSRKKAE